jgi:hypothetical protein
MMFPVLLGCLRPENLIIGCYFQVVQLGVLVGNYIEIAGRSLRLVLFFFLYCVSSGRLTFSPGPGRFSGGWK